MVVTPLFLEVAHKHVAIVKGTEFKIRVTNIPRCVHTGETLRLKADITLCKGWNDRAGLFVDVIYVAHLTWHLGSGTAAIYEVAAHLEISFNPNYLNLNLKRTNE